MVVDGQIPLLKHSTVAPLEALPCLGLYLPYLSLSLSMITYRHGLDEIKHIFLTILMLMLISRALCLLIVGCRQ
jgi:ABC-type microcin C transport system permease subunit YejE